MERNDTRHTGLDFLRVLSSIAVILLHVNFHFFQNRVNNPSLNQYYIIESIINIVTRISVPCFVMMSGAFNIHNNNKNAGQFYRKVVYKIGVPFIIVLVVLFTANEGVQLWRGTGRWGIPIKSVLTGEFYNLWYMYMLFGLYLLCPFIIIIKEHISAKCYKTMAVIMMLWACISQATSSQSLAYSIGVVFAFVAYYMMGNVIYEDYLSKGVYSQVKIICLTILALLMFAVSFAARYYGYDKYVSGAYTSFFSPTIIIASMCIFEIFLCLPINVRPRLAKWTYYIYLIHTVVYTLIFKFVDRKRNIDELLLIVLVTVLTVIISTLFAVVFDRALSMIEKNE